MCDHHHPAYSSYEISLPKHAEHSKAVDQPIAALMQDLKQCGLLEDTIAWRGSELGRTPYAQNNGTGRDHDPRGFTTWLAGGGFQPGYSHGATEELGFQGIEGRVVNEILGNEFV